MLYFKNAFSQWVEHHNITELFNKFTERRMYGSNWSSVWDATANRTDGATWPAAYIQTGTVSQ